MTTLNERLAWLAGIIDGEGHMSAKMRPPGRGRRGRTVAFQVNVRNTDAGMIREVCAILDAIGVGYFVGCYRQRHGNYKPLHSVTVAGRPRAMRLLTTVMPWLVTKRPHAELILKIAERRGRGLRASLSDPGLATMLAGITGLNRRGPIGEDAAAARPDSWGEIQDDQIDLFGIPHATNMGPRPVVR
jgi:hypothetical protein